MVATRLTKPLDYVQDVLSLRLRPGDLALDATAGNGRDTVFLARCVGRQGKVFALDVQATAVAATQARAADAGFGGSVEVQQGNHADLLELTPEFMRGKINAAMFNLGYLPGSDKEVITTPTSTLKALDACAAFLAPGGLLTIVVYSGHSGGAAEAAAVDEWCRVRDASRWHIVQYQQLNRPNNPPYAILAEKLPGDEVAVGRKRRR